MTLEFLKEIKKTFTNFVNDCTYISLGFIHDEEGKCNERIKITIHLP